ncbi:MAG TPA: hypothetical protein VF005_03130, partial [Acidimicrobiales bacterium]
MTVTQGPRLAPGDQWDDTGHEVQSVITLPPPAQEAGLGGAPARQADPGGVPAPHPRPGRAPLRVLPTEHLERRARRRRARLTITVAASLVAGSLLGVVALNVMIAQDQLRLDRLDAQR